jgi:hypothetical protein
MSATFAIGCSKFFLSLEEEKNIKILVGEVIYNVMLDSTACAVIYSLRK